MTLPVDGHVQVAPIPGRLQQLLLVPHSVQVFSRRGTDVWHQGSHTQVRHARLLLYNGRDSAVTLDKNTVVASGTLIFVTSDEGFLAEMESWEKQSHRGDGSGQEKTPEDKKEDQVDPEAEEVSEEWVIKEFKLDSNKFLKGKP
jgi:hypothetical protein